MTQQLNLDYLASKHAFAMVDSFRCPVKSAERTVTKALGVLQEQGLYACFLFLDSRGATDGANEVRDRLWSLTTELMGIDPTADRADYFANRLNDDLDNLLLVRDVFEQTLIYARYGAKAKP